MRSVNPPRHTDDDFVRSIVDELGPTIETDAKALIGALRRIRKFGPFAGYRKENAKFARKLREWIDDGESLLDALPKDCALLEILFGRQQNGRTNTPELLEAVIHQAQANREELVGQLEALRRRCEFIINERIGEHASAGFLQKSVAIGAQYLCEKAGEPLVWSNPKGPYRSVASLLYGAMTGKQSGDVERACERIAKRSMTTEKL
jgi:hypothetical protein